VAVLLGGEGTVIGPVLGALVLAGIPGVARAVGSAAGVAPERFEPVITSALLLPAVVVGRGGLVRLARAARDRIRGAHPGSVQAADERASLEGPRAAGPLVATGLSRRFGGVLALDEVSLDVQPGEIHALVGPNGSGKTTCLRILAGSEIADAGSIRLGERNLAGLTSTARVAAGIVRTLQRTAVFPDLTAVEHVAAGTLPSRRHGGTVRSVAATPKARAEGAEMRRRSAGLLAATGLGDLADRPGARLNGADQRLLMLATALGSRPGILLLDEPSSGMSLEETERLSDLLRDLRARGFGLLLVEHNLPLVRTVADRVTVLDAGRIIAAGTPDEVVADPAVREAYLGA
jgi:branched-chain amino acid transport system permease protein